jgi:biotin transport system substrate-specific component
MSSHAPSVGAVRVLADLIPGDRVRDAALTIGFALAIGLSAQFAFTLSFTPVPITGQTLVVLLGAIALGRGRAAAGSAAYATLGIVGVPWFAVTGGATLGYVIGFVAAAAVVGWVADRGYARSPITVAGAMVLGNLVIYAFGASVLAWRLSLDLFGALGVGVAPFLVGDAIKILVAVALVPTMWRQISRD